MTMIGAIALAALAGANWWSRWRDHERVELWTKPAVTIGFLIAALVVDADSNATRVLLVAGLVACLVGDVALLATIDRFIVGLAAFAVGHLLFAVAAVTVGARIEMVLISAVVVAPIAATAGRRIAASSGKLRPAVITYMALIFAMGVLAAGTGRVGAVIGAAAFVGSDTLLGWNRFVRRLGWAPPAIMVTYHLALAGLVGMLAG